MNKETSIKTALKAALITAACGALFACGSNGGSSAPLADTEPLHGSIASGTFVDAPIAGLSYECDDIRGTTDVNGGFTYKVGSPVVFKVGDIVIGSATGATVMTPVNFAGAGASADTPKVVAAVRFLKSISDEDAEGKLSIPGSVSAAAAGKSIDFDANNASDAVATMVPNVSAHPVVTEDEAKSHMKLSIIKLARGTYTGSWLAPASVPNNGSFTVTVNADGSMTGIAMLGSTRIDVTSTMSSQLVSGSTYAISGTVSNGAVWNGTINVATGALAGKALYDGVDATFSARK